MTESEDRPTWCSIENSLHEEFIYREGPVRPRAKFLPPRFHERDVSPTPYGLVHRINVEGCRIEVVI